MYSPSSPARVGETEGCGPSRSAAARPPRRDRARDPHRARVQRRRAREREARVRGGRAHLHIRLPGRPAVEGLRDEAVIGQVLRIVPAVEKDDRDDPLVVDDEPGVELVAAVVDRIVVRAHRRRPGEPGVVAVCHPDVEIAVSVAAVHEGDVEPAAVGARGDVGVHVGRGIGVDVPVEIGRGRVHGRDRAIGPEGLPAARRDVDQDRARVVAGPGDIELAVAPDDRDRELHAPLVAHGDVGAPRLAAVGRAAQQDLRVVEARPDDIEVVAVDARRAVAGDELLVLEDTRHAVDHLQRRAPADAAVGRLVHVEAVRLRSAREREHDRVEVARRVNRDPGIALPRIVRLDEEPGVGPGLPAVEGVAPGDLAVPEPEVAPGGDHVVRVERVDRDLLLVLQLARRVLVQTDVEPLALGAGRLASRLAARRQAA